MSEQREMTGIELLESRANRAELELALIKDGIKDIKDNESIRFIKLSTDRINRIKVLFESEDYETALSKIKRNVDCSNCDESISAEISRISLFIFKIDNIAHGFLN